MGFDFGGVIGGVVGGIIPGLAPRVSIPNPANGAVRVPGFPSRDPSGEYTPPTDPSKPDGSYQPSNGNNTDKMVNMVVMYGGMAIGAYVVYRVAKKVL